MEVTALKTKIFKENESLLEFIYSSVPALKERDILVITSKIMSLSQGRTDDPRNKEGVIKKCSKKTIQTPWAILTLTQYGWCINAGVDESNAKRKLILLPKNAFYVAETIRKKLKKHYSIKSVGVLVTDTKSIPLRIGTIGRSIAYAGFEPIKSYIGKKDLFGRKSRVTQSNIADALAASAVLVMGEGREQTPLAVIQDAPVLFTSKKIRKNLSFPPKKDIFGILYKKTG